MGRVSGGILLQNNQNNPQTSVININANQQRKHTIHNILWKKEKYEAVRLGRLMKNNQFWINNLSAISKPAIHQNRSQHFTFLVHSSIKK